MANLLVVPLAGLLTTGGVLTLAVATLSEPLAHTLFQSLWVLLVALRLVVRAFAALPGAIVYVPPPPPVAVAAAGLALLVLPWVRGSPPRSASPRSPSARRGPCGIVAGWARAVSFLDVGQGEAILVRAPDGSALLVDTGGGGPDAGTAASAWSSRSFGGSASAAWRPSRSPRARPITPAVCLGSSRASPSTRPGSRRAARQRAGRPRSRRAGSRSMPSSGATAAGSARSW